MACCRVSRCRARRGIFSRTMGRAAFSDGCSFKLHNNRGALQKMEGMFVNAQVE